MGNSSPTDKIERLTDALRLLGQAVKTSDKPAYFKPLEEAIEAAHRFGQKLASIDPYELNGYPLGKSHRGRKKWLKLYFKSKG